MSPKDHVQPHPHRSLWQGAVVLTPLDQTHVRMHAGRGLLSSQQAAGGHQVAVRDMSKRDPQLQARRERTVAPGGSTGPVGLTAVRLIQEEAVTPSRPRQPGVVEPDAHSEIAFARALWWAFTGWSPRTCSPCVIPSLVGTLSPHSLGERVLQMRLGLLTSGPCGTWSGGLTKPPGVCDHSRGRRVGGVRGAFWCWLCRWRGHRNAAAPGAEQGLGATGSGAWCHQQPPE